MTKNLTPTSQNPQASKLDELKKLLPEAFSEGRLDVIKLKTLFDDNAYTGNERYGQRYELSWAGKSSVYSVLKATTTSTLTPQPDESVNFDDSDNLFIEGDNLDVLKVLQKSYHKAVKMIYIDPPYNTGNDKFIYPDDYSESLQDYQARTGELDEEGNLASSDGMRANSKENGQYHSNWLSMMYPRLALAKNLLRDDGVIFVSIDDNEVANLRLLMDEIFGEENFATNFIWKSRQNVDSRNKSNISNDHEYILIYCRDINFFQLRGKSIDLTKYSNPDNDPKGS